MKYLFHFRRRLSVNFAGQEYLSADFGIELQTLRLHEIGELYLSKMWGSMKLIFRYSEP